MQIKNLCQRISALSLALLLTASLAGCGGGNGLTTKDASMCIQVEMDATYRGEFSGFVDFYDNATTQDARERYDANIEGEANFFLEGMGVPSLDSASDVVPASEMQLHRAKELYKQIYAKSDYTVVSSTKQDDGTFAVKVTIRPLDVFDLLDANYDAGFEDFWAKFEAVDTDSMTDEEYTAWYTETFASEYYDTLLDLLEAQIPNIGYKDEKSIVIQVEKDEDDVLIITDEDWMNLDNLIIDYSGS